MHNANLKFMLTNYQKNIWMQLKYTKCKLMFTLNFSYLVQLKIMFKNLSNKSFSSVVHHNFVAQNYQFWHQYRFNSINLVLFWNNPKQYPNLYLSQKLFIYSPKLKIQKTTIYKTKWQEKQKTNKKEYQVIFQKIS